MSPEIGAVLPSDIASKPKDIALWATEVEKYGFDYIVLYDHVVLVRNQRKISGEASYPLGRAFNEPLVLAGFLSAITRKVRLVTGVLVSPQRQTVLLAKQAAEVSLLSDGRLILGVGVGWNEAEYVALGIDFHKRGARIEEQIPTLRRLWVEEAVTHQGRMENLTNVGLNPRPTEAIPIWMGGLSPEVINRMARVADGWIFRGDSVRYLGLRNLLWSQLELNVRSSSNFGVMGKINLTRDTSPFIEYAKWIKAGATHVSLSTTGDKPQSVEAHLSRLQIAIKRMAI